MPKGEMTEFFSSKRFVLLSTLAFLLGGFAITTLSSRNIFQNQLETTSSDELTNEVPSLGNNNTLPSKNDSSSKNDLTDKDRLPNDLYAYFRVIQFYLKDGKYEKVVALAKRAGEVTGTDDVTILTIDYFLKEDVLSESSCDLGLEALEEKQKRREQFLGYVIQLINTLNDSSIRASYLVNLAERQRECKNELSKDKNLSWEYLSDEAESELSEIHSSSWWSRINYKEWFTIAFTACGFVISIVVKESVGGYTKYRMGEVLQKPDQNNSTTS